MVISFPVILWSASRYVTLPSRIEWMYMNEMVTMTPPRATPSSLSPAYCCFSRKCPCKPLRILDASSRTCMPTNVSTALRLRAIPKHHPFRNAPITPTKGGQGFTSGTQGRKFSRSGHLSQQHASGPGATSGMGAGMGGTGAANAIAMAAGTGWSRSGFQAANSSLIGVRETYGCRI